MPARTKTIAELRKELTVKERALAKLQSHRNTLARQIDSVDREINGLTGGGSAPRKRRRKKSAKAAKKTVRAKRVKKSKKAGKVKKVRRKRKASIKKSARKKVTARPLAQYIQAVLAKAKKGMRVTEVVKAVLKAGYRTKSKGFYGVVAAALRENKSFRRVRRGVYKLAG